MISFTLDEAAAAQLRQAEGLAEVRDPTGTVIGFFAPVRMAQAAAYATAAARIDRAELERRKNAPGKKYTTREVFEHLLSLTTDPAEQEHLRKLIAEVAERDRCTTP